MKWNSKEPLFFLVSPFKKGNCMRISVSFHFVCTLMVFYFSRRGVTCWPCGSNHRCPWKKKNMFHTVRVGGGWWCWTGTPSYSTQMSFYICYDFLSKILPPFFHFSLHLIFEGGGAVRTCSSKKKKKDFVCDFVKLLILRGKKTGLARDW